VAIVLSTKHADEVEESNMIFHFYFVSKLSKFRCRKKKRGQMILKVHSEDFRFDDSHVFASAIMWAKKKEILFNF
jgi:hypothetical protein